MGEKLMLREAILVEGRYDRIKLSGFIASPILETGGFRVFKDKEKQALIRAVAARRGVLVMTDVDAAGFVIRNFLRGIVPASQLLHAYIPTVKGKERRKPEPSKEGVLGVEGLDRESLLQAIETSGAHIMNSLSFEVEAAPQEPEDCPDTARPLTKLDLFEYGLSGAPNAGENRTRVLSDLGLPKYLTPNALLAALNCLFTKEEFEHYLESSDIFQ